jgi:peptide chain release factor 1
LLSREDIMKDMKQFLVLSREHTDVSAVASRWARYQQREADLATGQEMLSGADGDADMLQMAQEEIDNATAGDGPAGGRTAAHAAAQRPG